MLASLQTIVIKTIFFLVYSVYWVFRKSQVFLDFLQKNIYTELCLQGSRSDKVEMFINSLPKKPNSVSLSILCARKMPSNLTRSCVQKLINIIHLLDTVQVGKISVIVSGDTRVFQQLLEAETKQKLPEHILEKLTVLNAHQTKQQILNHKKIHNHTQVPLILSMADYPSTNGIPFPYLINAEIAFLPTLAKVGLQDIQRCFEQYCESKQRNGK